MSRKRTGLYASVGAVLTHYDLDLDGYALIKRGSITLPNDITYAWPHSSQPALYAVCSGENAHAEAASNHSVCALKIDESSGELSLHGKALPLPGRPINVTTAYRCFASSPTEPWAGTCRSARTSTLEFSRTRFGSRRTIAWPRS